MAQQPARCLIPFNMDWAAIMKDENLLFEILLRLPACSLTRFKSVCKKWRSIISSDYFCHHHTLHRPKLQSSLILYVPSCDEFFYFNQTINGKKTLTPYTKSSTFDPNHLYNIVQACNGLLLLVSEYYVEDPTTLKRSVNRKRDLITTYYVYNPTTKQSREISLTHNHESRRVVAIGLAFDPSLSPYYKIVCIWLNLDSAHSYSFHIEVYYSESQSWKVSMEAFTHSNAICPSSFSSKAASGVYWNNSIYWKSGMNGGSYFRFDIALNEMKPLPFPQTPDLTCSGTKQLITRDYLQESNGHLYHFKTVWESLMDDRGVFGQDESAESVAVWKLGGHSNDQHLSHDQWLFKYHHTFGDGKKIINRNLIKIMVESDGDGGDETCRLLTYSRAGKMKAYNFLNKTFEDLFYFKTDTDFVLGFQFGEILALV